MKTPDYITTKLPMPKALAAFEDAPPHVKASIRARISRLMIKHCADCPRTQPARVNWQRDIIRQAVQDEIDDLPLPPVDDDLSDLYDTGLTVGPRSSLHPDTGLTVGPRSSLHPDNAQRGLGERETGNHRNSAGDTAGDTDTNE